MTEKTVAERLEIKNLKTWNTHDGGGYQCSLWFDGVRIGDATDHGHGGCLDVTFLPHVSVEIRELLDNAAWDILDEGDPKHCYDQPFNANFPHGDRLSFLIEPKVNEFDLNKRLRTLCRTKVVLKEGEEYFTLKGKYNPIHKAAILAKYPKVTIVNEQFM